MDQLHLLFLLSFSMLIGAFFSGTVPMAFKLSETKSRLLALMGSGILVGTALSIIIPEGIDSIYGQSAISPAPNSDQHHIGGHSPNVQPMPEPVVQTWTIGVSLVAGFILMLFIDQFSLYQTRDGSSHLHQHHEQHEYSLANQEEDSETVYSDDNNMAETNGRSDTPDTNAMSETRPIRDSSQHRVTIRGIGPEIHGSSGGKGRQVIRNNGSNTKVTPTLGLVIHSAADGIALGAAATTSHRHVEMIIFLAIMLHKAPAAFSLVVFLIHRGLKHSTIRRHLLAFSLSAPIAALLTYFGLSQSGKEALRRNNATGIAMLFSAGTFLYVATVHVLPELVHNKLLTPKEMLFLVGGAFLPILLAQTI